VWRDEAVKREESSENKKRQVDAVVPYLNSSSNFSIRSPIRTHVVVWALFLKSVFFEEHTHVQHRRCRLAGSHAFSLFFIFSEFVVC
jgi:hypothetical protein